MRDAFFITLTLIILFVIIGFTYNLMSPYLVKLGVIDGREKIKVLPDGGIFRSQDFARTWVQVDAPSDDSDFAKSDVFGLEFSPHDARMIYAATSRGLFVSSDTGNNWRSVQEESAVAFALDPKDPERMYLAVGSENKRSRILKKKGTEFYEVYSTASANNRISGLWVDPFDPSVVYAGTSRGILLWSRDFGESWGILHEFSGAINDLEMLPSDTRVLYIATGGLIFKSPNQGKEFEQIWQVIGGGAVNDLAINSYNEAMLYAGTSSGLFGSRDSGKTFEQIKLPVGDETPAVSAVIAPGIKDGLLILGSNSQIYKSDDAGGTWQIKTLASSRKVNLIRIKPDDPRVLFAGVSQ